MNNLLHISGDAAALEHFQQSVAGIDDFGKESLLVFQSLIPEPTDLPDVTEQMLWREDEWGTKALPMHVTRTALDGQEVTYHFRTTNSGCTPWLQAACAAYPQLTFRYAWCEPEQEMAGWLDARGADVLNLRSPDDGWATHEEWEVSARLVLGEIDAEWLLGSAHEEES